MNHETQAHLNSAIKHFGQCAKLIADRGAPTLRAKEPLIAVGTARDWLRWAAALSTLQFSTKGTCKSARKEGVSESVRFMQMWTATNSLFAHDSILSHTTTANPLPTDELRRFRLLYTFASVQAATETACIRNLHQLLGMQCATRDVTPALGTGYPTMWEVIYHKYSRPVDQRRGIGRLIGNAIARGVAPTPDGPALIYAARNWTVHGVLLTSFFRGSLEKYLTFMDALQFLLAAALDGAATQLETRL